MSPGLALSRDPNMLGRCLLLGVKRTLQIRPRRRQATPTFYQRSPGRIHRTQFSSSPAIALNLGHRGARIKSKLDTGHVAETASQIAERGASHPIGRRGASLPSINDYDLTTRRMDVDAPRPRCPFCGRPCSLGSMNCPLCKPSTAMAAKCCSTFRRKLVFRESPCLCSRETD
jgi:hypothetical protein